MNARYLVSGLMLALGCSTALADDLDDLFSDDAMMSSEEAAPQSSDGSDSGEQTETQPLVAIELAEEKPPVVRAVRAKAMLEEIVVTAQKKVESLQDAPITITSLNAEDLEVRGIGGLADMKSQVPSMTVEPFPTNANTLRIFIRGIGSIGSQVSQDPPVSIYLDGVYLSRPNGLGMEIGDIERIEVLKGPQGTLYGRNSTGGAINIISRQPDTDAISARQQLSLGNFGLFSSKSLLNLPLSDNAALKLSYLNSRKDGYIENAGPGGDFGDKTAEGLVAALRWDLSDSLDLGYKFERLEQAMHQFMPQGQLPPSDHGTTSDQINERAQERTLYSDSRISTLRTFAPLMPSTHESQAHSLTLSWGLDALDLKYIFSDRRLTDFTYIDFGGGVGDELYRADSGAFTSFDGSLHIDAGGTTLRHQQQSHEINLSGGWDTLDVMAGAFAIDESSTEVDPFRHQLSALLDAAPAPAQMLLTNTMQRTLTVDNSAWAAYLQLDWRPQHFNDRLGLQFGYRYSEDERRASKVQQARNFVQDAVLRLTPPVEITGVEFPLTTPHRQFTDSSFSFVAQYDISDSINGYAKVIEAYRTGYFNSRDPDPESYARGVNPEKVRSYELGLKSELLDRRLRLNLAGFVSDYSDMQVQFLVPGTIADTVGTNAGNARLSGAEMDLTFLVTRELMALLSYGYLHTEVLDAVDAEGNDVTDQLVFASAPRHSYTASLNYRLPEFNWGSVNLNLAYSFQDQRNGSFDVGNVPFEQVDAFGLWSARLSAELNQFMGGSLRAGLWGKNLADTDFVTIALSNLPNTDRAVFWNEPCSFGLDLIFEY